MMRIVGVLALSLVLLCGSTSAWAGKQKTGKEEGNVYSDALYGFTFEKNDNWKFKIKKEKPEKPENYRFTIQKVVYQLPPERRFSRETWNVAYGGFFVDTTSLDLDGFKTLLIEENRKHKQKGKFTKFAEIVRDGAFAAEKRITFGNLAPGYQLTYKQEFDLQIKDVRGNYDIVTDFLMGDIYFTVNGGKVYIFFFTSERSEYRLCLQDIGKMLPSITFPGQEDEKKPSTAADTDSTKAESEPDEEDTDKGDGE